MDRFNQRLFSSLYNVPWKQHQKQRWLESSLKQLYKKLADTMKEAKEADPNAMRKLKMGKSRWKKLKYCGFPVVGRKKSRVKRPLVNAIYTEDEPQNEVEFVPAPKELPKAKKFWKYVDACYKLQARNVREAKEAVKKEEAKKAMKLLRRKKRHAAKKKKRRYKCFARTRPGFLTSVIMDTNFFYPIILRKHVMNLAFLKDVRSARRSARISKARKQQNDVEKTKPKLKARWDPERNPNLELNPNLEPNLNLEPNPNLELNLNLEPNSNQEPNPNLEPSLKVKLQTEPQRCSARFSSSNTKKCVEDKKPESQKCEASKPKMKKKERKSFVAVAKPKNQCKRKSPEEK